VGAGQPIRVAIIDDEVLFAKVLGAWLVGVGGLIIAGYATGGHPGWELCVASMAIDKAAGKHRRPCETVRIRWL
jgi:hypothetical protein